MNTKPTLRQLRPTTEPRHLSPVLWVFMASCVILILIGFLRSPPRQDSSPGHASATSNVAEPNQTGRNLSAHPQKTVHRSRSGSSPVPTPEEIVTTKVAQFGRTRRDLVHAVARRSQKEVPPEVERFFDAIESGNWDDIKAQWDALSKRSGQYEGSKHSPELDSFWPSILDAYGVAEQAHLWPAQQLLDYGHAILDSLKPGMIYVGGTDNGRWVPELLNDTSDGEHHIIVTQNALADGRYLEFVSDLYGGQLTALTKEDSQRGFQQYMDDAKKRFDHDQQFPDEPKQVRPGEDIKFVDGKVQVSGQVAVMMINEKLLGMLMDKNPDRSFAIQESFPLTGTYPGALPLGPLMELRAPDGQDSFTAERAAQSLDYWRNQAQQILADPEAAGSDAALKSYSHDAVAAANLLAAHDFNAEAEQAYRLATQLCPANPEAAGDLAALLAHTGRGDEAQQLLDDFNRQHPDERKNLEKTSAAWGVIVSTQPAKP